MGDFTKGNMIFELGDIISEWKVLWDGGSGEPGDSFIFDINVDKWCLKVSAEGSPVSQSGRGKSEGFFGEGGCPGCGRSFLHEG